MILKIRRAINLVQSESGESLVETLVAVLISALSMLMLSSAVTSAKNIIITGRSSISEFLDNDAALATYMATDVSNTWDGDVKIEFNGSGSTTKVNVKYVKESLPGKQTGYSYEAR